MAALMEQTKFEEYALQSMKPIFKTKVDKSNVYFSYELRHCNGHKPCLFSEAYIDFKFPPPGHHREVTIAVPLGELISNVFSVIRQDDVCGIRIERPLGEAEDDRLVIQESALQIELTRRFEFPVGMSMGVVRWEVYGMKVIYQCSSDTVITAYPDFGPFVPMLTPPLDDDGWESS